ncbi:hypothetical protein RHMOL_Rhmol07G0066800 [Rhododendron molle]|uniref:Uncharacterized protein n=1 Tax=Rhododendron molle TaxID=49168 RepID=A0ACC0MY04_RHOML|nr:hypothetical protein RHMOL_Rhmol07G0066800 [Rhododendron molle]
MYINVCMSLQEINQRNEARIYCFIIASSVRTTDEITIAPETGVEQADPWVGAGAGTIAESLADAAAAEKTARTKKTAKALNEMLVFAIAVCKYRFVEREEPSELRD